MKISNIYKSNLLIVLLTIGFSACSDNASFTNDLRKSIALDVTCANPATVDDYIELQSGDIISKIETNTSVTTYHDVNDVKKVCLNYGQAEILRVSE